MNLLLKVGAVALASTPLAPNSTPYSDGTPPVRFQGDNVAAIIFADDITPYCGKSDKPGMIILACSQDNKIAIPNPCKIEDRDYYAHLLCHELGHVNGWPATHGD